MRRKSAVKNLDSQKTAEKRPAGPQTDNKGRLKHAAHEPN